MTPSERKTMIAAAHPTAIDYENIVPATRYFVLCTCGDCAKELNRTCEMSGDEIRGRWMKLVLTAPLNAAKCPNGCRATYSDCNLNHDLVILPA